MIILLSIDDRDFKFCLLQFRFHYSTNKNAEKEHFSTLISAVTIRYWETMLHKNVLVTKKRPRLNSFQKSTTLKKWQPHQINHSSEM